jgi:RNA polymerase sigma-70 factor, ECF subfamily
LADASCVIDMTSMATARLVEQARDPTASLHQQHAAFAQLVQQSQPVVFALALASLRDVEDAKECSQEAIKIAWQALPHRRDGTAIEPWLKSIVVRECARRRRQRSLVPEAMAPPATVEAEAERAEYQDLVAAALDELPERERHLTVLFYFLGYSQPQIAQLLRLKPGTVGKRLHSARLRIRRRLPRSVRSDFVRHLPAADFAAPVRARRLDEYIGE